MIDTLNQLDHELMLWLNYDGGTLQDAFWYAISNMPSWIPFYIVILGVLAYGQRREAHPWRQYLTLLLFTALIITAADHISSGIIKPWVQRPRPSHQEGVMEFLHYVHDYHGGAFGFVSSHAADTFALATWVSLLFRRRAVTLTLILYAVLNCYSRIYLGVHYPGDILCGTALGILCGWLLYRVYAWTCHRWQLQVRQTTDPRLIILTFWLTLGIMLGYAIFQAMA